MDWEYELAADMRYRGQTHCVPVPVPGDGPRPEQDPGALRARFEEAYLARYRRKIHDVPVEVAAWRLTLLGPPPAGGFMNASLDGSVSRDFRKGTRRMYAGPEAGFADGAVYDRYALPENESFTGPAVVEERESTILIPSGASFRKDASGNVEISWE